MTERRRIGRWSLSRPVHVRIAENRKVYAGTLKDLTFQGMMLSLPKMLAKDIRMKLTLILDDALTVTPEVWVAWHKKSGDGAHMHGLYFSYVDAKDKGVIYQYVYKYGASSVQESETMKSLKGEDYMPVQEAADKRIFERMPVRLPMRVLNVGLNQEYQAYTHDISAKGIGFDSQEPIGPKSSIEMWLSLQGQADPLYTRGEVVWAEPTSSNAYRVGVSLERADLMGISRVLRRD